MTPSERLTPKEIQIAILVWEGLTNREIGKIVGTSEQVIKNHLRSTFDKLGVWSRLELAMYVASHGGKDWPPGRAPRHALQSGGRRRLGRSHDPGTVCGQRLSSLSVCLALRTSVNSISGRGAHQASALTTLHLHVQTLQNLSRLRPRQVAPRSANSMSGNNCGHL